MIVTPDNGPAFIASALSTSEVFTTAGLAVFDPLHPDLGSGIVVDDGSDAALLGVEGAVNGRGLCLIVGTFDEGVASDSVDGASLNSTRFQVVARENVAINRGQNGTGIRCDRAIVEAIRAILTTPTGSHVHRRFISASFRNLRVENGTWNCSASVSIPTVIK